MAKEVRNDPPRIDVQLVSPNRYMATLVNTSTGLVEAHLYAHTEPLARDRAERYIPILTARPAAPAPAPATESK